MLSPALPASVSFRTAENVYAHDWDEGDFVIFHNRGLIHFVVGAFAPDELRQFKQCNIAGGSLPVGPQVYTVAPLSCFGRGDVHRAFLALL